MDKVVENLETFGDVPLARFGHTITMINKTKVILFGGATGDTGKYSMIGETYSFDCPKRTWTKLNIHGITPSPRAAHAAVNVEILQMVIYGGATGGGSLASDDLYLLDLRQGEESAQWMIVPVVGATPGRRYGHTIVFLKPYLIIFGGNTGTEVSNDVWCLSVDKAPFSWNKLDCGKECPTQRVYHCASLCVVGSASGMMVVFGGRGNESSSLNDTWGLRRHRDGSWDWVKAPYKTGSYIPTGRYQNSILFYDSTMVIVGGRSNNISENIGFDAYDTESSECFNFTSIKRFRHASWLFDNNVYVYGGFSHDMPNVPTTQMLKIDLLALFRKNENLLPKNLLKEDSKFSKMQKNLNNSGSKQINLQNENDLRLASQAYVAISYNLEETNEKNKLVRKVSIDKLNEESKKLLGAPSKIGISTSEKNISDNICELFITQLLKPKEFSNYIEPKMGFQKKLILQLIQDCSGIVELNPIILYLKSPVKIFGGIFGQFADLMKFFDLWKIPDNKNGGDIECMDYLFLGDYVDRGTHSLEVIFLLMALKVKFPNSIHMLRGHHEDIQINKNEGLGFECSTKLGEDINDPSSVFSAINHFFNLLPLVAIIDDKICCLHGGIGINFTSIDDLNKIKRPLEIIKEPNTLEHHIVLDILWSDPAESDDQIGFNPNLNRNFQKTNTIVKFGYDKMAQFLKENKLNLLIRSHECIMDGFERTSRGMVISLISATNYCGQVGNSASILVVQKNSELVPKIIMHTDKQNAKLWLAENEFQRKIQITPSKTRQITK